MKVEPAKEEDVFEISNVVTALGLPVAPDKLRKFFFEAPLMHKPEMKGGFAVKGDDGEIVGFCGLSPAEVAFCGKIYPAYQMGVLAIKPGFGGAMFEIMDKVSCLAETSVVYANTANKKSGMLWTGYAGFKFGPVECGFCQYEWLPSLLWAPFLYAPGKKADEAGICGGMPDAECGLQTVRTPERINWLYGTNAASRGISVITDGTDALPGYAVLRTRPLRKLPLARFEILDICSPKNDPAEIDRLVAKAKKFAASHYGVIIEYIGARKLLKRRRKLQANPFIWKTGIPELNNALSVFPDSFFGPYDGDRSIG